MTATTGLLRGRTIELDAPLPVLDGRRMRVMIGPADPDDTSFTPEQHGEMWAEWVARGDHGPLEDGRGRSTVTISRGDIRRSSHDLKLERCPACGRPGIELRQLDKTYEIGGVAHTVVRIPMHVCPHCGERFLGPRAAAYVDRALGLGTRRQRKPRAA